MSDRVTIRGELVHETPKALLIKTSWREDWYPKSQISRTLRMQEAFEKPVQVEIDVPEWLADAKEQGDYASTRESFEEDEAYEYGGDEVY